MPRGIADAFRVGKKFVKDEDVALILGDNIFISNDLQVMLQAAAAKREGARLFACQVRDPERFGVVEIDRDSRVISLEEKPKIPKSRWAVTGLYFYDNSVVDAAADLQPSARRELEITALNDFYLQRGALHVEQFGRGVIWIDAGTHDSLVEASVLVQALQKRHNQMIGSPEEVAYRLGYMGKQQLEAIADEYSNGEYGHHLRQILDE